MVIMSYESAAEGVEESGRLCKLFLIRMKLKEIKSLGEYQLKFSLTEAYHKTRIHILIKGGTVWETEQ